MIDLQSHLPRFTTEAIRLEITSRRADAARYRREGQSRIANRLEDEAQELEDYLRDRLASVN
jgi:hypothetical protein